MFGTWCTSSVMLALCNNNAHVAHIPMLAKSGFANCDAALDCEPLKLKQATACQTLVHCEYKTWTDTALHSKFMLSSGP